MNELQKQAEAFEQRFEKRYGVYPDIVVREAFISGYSTSHAEVERLREALKEARRQIEYLHEKFTPTGTSETVLARIDAALSPNK